MTLRNTGLKLIIAFVAVILAVLVFNANAVYATDDTDLQNILDKIPDTMELDIKEVEYEKAKDIVKSKVENVLKENANNFNVKDINIDIDGQKLYFIPPQDIKELTLTIVSGEYSKSKTINLIYSNTKQYNSDDAEYVKSINLTSPMYYEVDLNFISNNAYDKFMNIIEKYYSNIINDSTITVKALSGASGTDGGLNYWTWESGTVLALFKNGILYDIKRIGGECTVPVINISQDVSDEEITNYIKQVIKAYDSDFADDIETITKGAVVKYKNNLREIPNGYTIKTRLREGTSYVIIKREETKTTPITNTDTTTKIKLDTTTEVVPAGTTLVAEKVTSGTSYNTVVTALGKDVSKFEMYDISLMNNNAKIQPNGKVKVSIPVPSGFDASKIVVYRVADDGTKTKLDATVKDGYVVFETDHFSNYVVAEQATSTENTNKDTTETKTENKNTDRELDNTPKTGEETNVISVVATIVSVISALGLAVIKKF